MQNVRYVPMGYQQISAETLGSSTSLTVPAGAEVAIIRAEVASVRWRDDGNAPTTTVGMPMANTDQPLEYWGTLGNLAFIAESGSPILNVSYYAIAG